MLRMFFSLGFICLQVLILSGCNSTASVDHQTTQNNAVKLPKQQGTSTLQSEVQIDNAIALQNRGLSNQKIILSSQSDSPAITTNNYVSNTNFYSQTQNSNSNSQSNHAIDFRSEYDAALKQHGSSRTSLQPQVMDASIIIVNDMQMHNQEKPKHWNDQPTPNHGINCTWKDGKSSCSSY